jgi:hypothetical protein
VFRTWSSCSALLLVSELLACARPSPGARSTPSELPAAESLYADLREARDQIDIALALGHTGITDVTPLPIWTRNHNALRRSVLSRLAAIDSTGLGQDDRRALEVMRRALDRDIDSLTPLTAAPAEAETAMPSCRYDPRAVVARSRGLD